MSKVFFDVGVSLDGYIAGPNGGPRNPLGDGGVGLHQWAFKTATFLERIGVAGGETSQDDVLVRQVFDRAGAYVMGRRMFDEGEISWPENPPFRAPVFVLTHSAREPWVKVITRKPRMTPGPCFERALRDRKRVRFALLFLALFLVSTASALRTSLPGTTAHRRDRSRNVACPRVLRRKVGCRPVAKGSGRRRRARLCRIPPRP